MKQIKWLLILMVMACSAEGWAQQCTVSAVAVSFGGYDITAGSPLNGTGSIDVTCKPATVTVVKLDPGKHSGGDYSQRKMYGKGDYLIYNLYTDAACTKIWGDGTNNTFTQPGASNLTVYGRIPALQKVKPGDYNDFVTIVVEW